MALRRLLITVLRERVTFYTPQDERTWFGIGAVHGPEGQLVGVAIAVGSRAVAFHRTLDAGER